MTYLFVSLVQVSSFKNCDIYMFDIPTYLLCNVSSGMGVSFPDFELFLILAFLAITSGPHGQDSLHQLAHPSGQVGVEHVRLLLVVPEDGGDPLVEHLSFHVILRRDPEATDGLAHLISLSEILKRTTKTWKEVQ